ncbi:MAG: hypothetical protein ACXW4M_12610 [Anaerolineales bacterium]
MKTSILLILMAIALSACNGWTIQPLPNNPPTPFLPPTLTPSIFTATPVVIAATATPNVSTSTPVATATILPTNTGVFPSDTPIATWTSAPGQPSVSVEVLGCDTSIDVTHGMGEVTNAFVTLENTGNVDLINLTTTLMALDEGREHPDKTVETTFLQAGYQVTLKLTVDSTYQAETPIQVEVMGEGGLFRRVGAASCRDIGLLAPDPSSLNTPMPSQ